jgi:hypothetical protein
MRMAVSKACRGGNEKQIRRGLARGEEKRGKKSCALANFVVHEAKMGKPIIKGRSAAIPQVRDARLVWQHSEGKMAR